jgi:hypothetical protein
LVDVIYTLDYTTSYTTYHTSIHVFGIPHTYCYTTELLSVYYRYVDHSLSICCLYRAKLNYLEFESPSSLAASLLNFDWPQCAQVPERCTNSHGHPPSLSTRQHAGLSATSAPHRCDSDKSSALQSYRRSITGISCRHAGH